MSPITHDDKSDSSRVTCREQPISGFKAMLALRLVKFIQIYLSRLRSYFHVAVVYTEPNRPWQISGRVGLTPIVRRTPRNPSETIGRWNAKLAFRRINFRRVGSIRFRNGSSIYAIGRRRWCSFYARGMR